MHTSITIYSEFPTICRLMNRAAAPLNLEDPRTPQQNHPSPSSDYPFNADSSIAPPELVFY